MVKKNEQNITCLKKKFNRIEKKFHRKRKFDKIWKENIGKRSLEKYMDIFLHDCYMFSKENFTKK